MNRLLPLAIAALVLAGCTAEDPPASCEDGGPTPTGATVPLTVRVVHALDGQAIFVPVEAWAGDLAAGRPKLESDHPCTLAAGGTINGTTTLQVPAGTWHLLVGGTPEWTFEIVENLNVQPGMAEVVVPVWPTAATYWFNGTLTGLDPQGDTETEASFQLFGDLSADLQAGSFERADGDDGPAFTWKNLRLAWMNDPTSFADLGVRLYHGDTFSASLDDGEGTELGPQTEEATGDGFGFNRTDAIRDGFFIRVSDTGPMVAPQGLPFSLMLEMRFSRHS